MIARDLIVIIAIVVTALLGIGLRVKKITDIRWNIIYVLPAVMSVIHFLCSNRNIFMYPVYFGAFLELLILLLRKKRVLAIIITIFSMIFAISPQILAIATNSSCYSSLGYAEAFTAFHEDVKAHYALQEWKETDFDAKYEEYIGLFEEAEQKQDKTAYIQAMLSYLASYQDGHVQMWDMYENFGLGSTGNIQNTYTEIYKNYYGMTLLQLDNGEYVAANVENGSSAQAAGIKNGTVIKKWNGTSVAEQLAQMEYIIPVNCFMFADIENIERFKPFFLSCMGEEQMEVEFFDEQGNTKNVTLTSMGNGYPYLYRTIGAFLQKEADTEASINEENLLFYCTLENGIGYLQITGMLNNYDEIRADMERYIAQMKKDEISSLIVDVRNNEGGEDETGAIIAEQFATEDLFYLEETTYDVTSGEYIENRTLRMDAKAAIDVPIYLMVNSECISAGEGFAYNMAKLPQVTVVGIQGTNGSFGTIDGIVMMPEGMMGVYPSIACLDEDGEVMIDSRYRGTGGIKPELVIPVDEEAVEKLFKEGYDYELEYLLNNIISH
ncbi:MAG: S41 family peptidase [Lachnospiraceae bacterium]|nr:S41 family peptidase [Lachnospiraceae bacterium]